MSENKLAERIENLERDNRRLKRLCFAALVLAALGLFGQLIVIPCC